MKLECTEMDHALYVELIPETPEEVSILARYAMNANAEKPGVYMSVYGKPYLSITLNKRKKSVHKTSIKP